MIPVILATLLTELAKNGLGMLGNAVLNKGKQAVEEKLGVSIDSELQTQEGRQLLLQLQNDHEEFLINAAIEDKKVDLEFYRVDAVDRDSARQREIGLATTGSSWLAKNIVPVLALIIVIGGGCGIIFSPDADVRLGLTSVIALVIGYYFGTSKGADRQTAAIQNLSQGASK